MAYSTPVSTKLLFDPDSITREDIRLPPGRSLMKEFGYPSCPPCCCCCCCRWACCPFPSTVGHYFILAVGAKTILVAAAAFLLPLGWVLTAQGVTPLCIGSLIFAVGLLLLGCATCLLLFTFFYPIGKLCNDRETEIDETNDPGYLDGERARFLCGLGCGRWKLESGAEAEIEVVLYRKLESNCLPFALKLDDEDKTRCVCLCEPNWLGSCLCCRKSRPIGAIEVGEEDVADPGVTRKKVRIESNCGGLKTVWAWIVLWDLLLLLLVIIPWIVIVSAGWSGAWGDSFPLASNLTS